MGVFRAIASSVGSVAKEQWKEAFFCDALDGDTLMLRVHKYVSDRSANNRAGDEIVSNGSVIAVNEGQCVIVTAQGRVLGACDTPGAHEFFDPNHTGGVRGFFRDAWSRVGFGGGDVQPIRHRVYCVNTKEIPGNAFETPSPIPVRVRDEALHADFDLSLYAAGVYAYRVADPEALYRVAGNVAERYEKATLNRQLAAEILSALQQAIADTVQGGVRPYEIPNRIPALAEAAKEAVQVAFVKRFGIALLSLAFSALTVTDVKMLSGAQQAAVNKDPTMAAATRTQALADAIRAAKLNKGK